MPSVGELAAKGISAYGEVYIHYDRKNFFKNANPSAITGLADDERTKIYAKHRVEAERRLSALLPSGFFMDEYKKMINSTTEVLEGILTGPGQEEIIKKMRETLNQRKEIGLSSKWKRSKTKDFSKELRELMKDVDEVERVMNETNKLMRVYKDIDGTVLKLKSARGAVGSLNPDELYILKDQKSASTAYKNITKGLDDLKNIVESAKSSGSMSIAKGDSEVAMEIINNFAGQLNNIQGLGFEVVLGSLLEEDNLSSKLEQAILKGISAKGVSVTKIDAEKGQSYVNDIYQTRKTTDIGIEVSVDTEKLTGKFELNLSAKSMPKLTEGGLKKATTTYKSQRPWGRIADELGLLNSELEYYFDNLSVKPTQKSWGASRLKDAGSSYAAIKNYISVAYALHAVAGTGIKDDAVTHMVYLNKVMTVTEVIDSLANTQLNVTLGKAPVSQESVFQPGDPGTAKYIRSKLVLSKVRDITFRFSK